MHTADQLKRSGYRLNRKNRLLRDGEQIVPTNALVRCQTCMAYTEKDHGIAVAPLHIQTNYFFKLAVDLAFASVDLPWAIFDAARACSDSFRPSSCLDASCFAAALVW